MRTLVFFLIAALCGTGLGYWRVNEVAKKFPDVIGEDIDLDSIAIAANQVNSADTSLPKFSETTGVASILSIPKIEVIDGTDLDFGTMKRGTSRSHAFRFKNAGGAPLELTVLGSTCKCTIGSLKKSVLEPGEETEVSLTWRAEGQLSSFAQTATIGTNDPRKKEIQLTIHGKIGQNYILEPEELSFGDFSARETFSKTFQLFSFEETPLEASGYWADLDQKKVQVSRNIRKIEPGEYPEHADARYVADFVVDVLPGMPAGPVNGQVRLDVGKDRFPMSVRCTGKCVSDLRIVAGSDYDEKNNVFNMGKFNSTDGGEKIIYIAARKAADQEIELKLKKVLPESLVGAFDVIIGEPTKNPTQTLFPVTIRIPKGSREISRGGTSPSNYIKLFFETNLVPAGEINLYLKLIVEAE